MQVVVENINTLGRRLVFTLPSELIEQETNESIQKKVSTANIKGFRPGKASFKIVKQHYGEALRLQVVEKQIQQSLKEALKKESLTPAGRPSVDIVTLQPNQPFVFTAEFEIYPEVSLKTLEGETIEKIMPDIQDSDIDTTIEAIRKQHVTFKDVARAAQMGDEVVIDFAGSIEGEPLEGGTGTDMPLVLGSHRFISGFEEGLVASKAGDEITLNLSFPEDYHHKPIAGKPVTFVVQIKSVREQQLPALDSEFVKMFNMADDSVDTFRAEIRKNMEREARQTAKNKLRQNVFDKLLARNTLDLPQALVNEEIERLQQEASQELKKTYKIKSAPTLPKEIFEERARYRVKLGLLLMKARELFAPTLDQNKVQQILEEFASLYQDSEQAIGWLRNNEQKMREIENAALEEQIIEKLMEVATLVEKKESYSDLMQKNKQHAHDHSDHEHGPDCKHDHDDHEHGPNCNHDHE
ncbi:MAG: trigger factor [Gammaproteobacteria bacterium]|nr:trigger factor [Gammaproteobacteria bacterium]